MASYNTDRMTFGFDTYHFVDLGSRIEHNPLPLQTKTYTDIIATANDNKNAGFFYMKVVPNSFNNDMFHIKVHLKATVPGNINYITDSTFDLWGIRNTYIRYESRNTISNTSYRPIYYHSYFRVSELGYNNNCGHWIGFNLYNSTNPTDTSVKRTVVIDLLQYDNCAVEMQDELIKSTNIPNRSAHTNWYYSSETSFDNFDACSNGLKQTGDANTTSIQNLLIANGRYVTDSVLYRYQMLFQMNENTLTPLNNNSNVTAATKTMLTDAEFDPFGNILYYASATTISAGGLIPGSSLGWQYSSIDIRYTFNVVNGDLAINQPVYLMVTPTSNGKCKIASASPLTQTLPSTNDGKWYILLGYSTSWYQMGFEKQHSVYMHDGTGIRRLDHPVAAMAELISGSNYRIIL